MALPSESKSVVILDDDRSRRETVAARLDEAGYRVTASSSGSQAEGHLAARQHDAILLALDWPSEATPERVASMKRLAGSVPLLLLCPANRIGDAVIALRHGAQDYLMLPPDRFELEARLDRILERYDLDSRIAFFQDELSKRAGFKNLEARSPAMRAVLDRVLRVAPMRTTVLAYGESGVGKELVARAIHFNSPRRNGPFIALNCAAMPASLIESELFGHEKGSFTGAHARSRGKFEIAHRGTLFLDEIAEMDPATQAKLLRVLEEKEFMRVGGDRSIRVDVRVVAATNADLDQRVASQRFRQDLYYRLKVVTITIPPLRERRPDIPALVDTFMQELSGANAIPPKRVTPEAMEALLGYHWPGNVRELKNLLESALVSLPGDRIRLEDLPGSVRKERLPIQPTELTPGTTLADMERELIRRTLEYTGGNRTYSASLLGIGVRTLQRKIRAYDLDIPPKRRRSRRRDGEPSDAR